MSNFTTRTDATDAVVAAIEATGVVPNAWDEYDVDAIVDEAYGATESGYALRVDRADFWQIVERNART